MATTAPTDTTDTSKATAGKGRKSAPKPVAPAKKTGPLAGFTVANVKKKVDSLPEGTGALVAAGAAGVAVGLAAALGRKVAVQAASGLSGDWAATLATEHRMALKIFDAMQSTDDSDKGKRSTLLMQLKHALGKHAFQEENVIYPALRDHQDAEHADSLNHDHGYVKQFLYDLEMMPKTSAGWLPKVAEFRAAIEKHVREEEDKIFPALQAKLTADENAKLTAAMNKEGFKLA